LPLAEDDGDEDEHGELGSQEEEWLERPTDCTISKVSRRPSKAATIRDWDKNIYVGNLLEGTMEKGKGIFKYTYSQGPYKGKTSVYEGEITNGQMEGQGITLDAAGCEYQGAFRCGAAHGYGVCTWEQGWTYNGEWVMDQREGKGTLRQTNIENGEVYQGEWKNDQWHGKGELKFAGGGNYVGNFKNHKLDGFGRVRRKGVFYLFANHHLLCWLTFALTHGLLLLFYSCTVRICRRKRLRRQVQERPTSGCRDNDL
jgi:hypothetical protein